MIQTILVVLSLVGAGRPTVDSVSVHVPVRHDWVFTDGKNCKLDVTLSGNSSLKGVTLDLALVTDLSLMSEKRDTILVRSKRISTHGDSAAVTFHLGRLDPGFYQVNLAVAGAKASFAPFRCFNIGVEPEKIVSPQDKPDDFDEFWAKNLAELTSVPVDATYEYVPEHSDSLRATYIVKMKSLGGVTVGGILCKPVKPGKYTTFIDYLGYGANIYWYDPAAYPDRVEFLLSVRDQGIFKRKNHYRWIDRGLSSKEEFYYRGAFCDVVRAIDFISGLDCVDMDNLFARSESQGGAFALVSVSLDHRIKACAPSVPFLSDYHDYSRIVSWPLWEMFDQCKKEGIGREDMFEMLRYFDIKNFTDRITCPVYMAYGLQDATCPPHTNFAGFNQIQAPKELYVDPLQGHSLWSDKTWHAFRAKFFEKV